MHHASDIFHPAAFFRFESGDCLRSAYGGLGTKHQHNILFQRGAGQKAKAADETMTVVATGNQRSSFEAPMMVTVIEGNSPESQTATSAADMLRRVPGITVNGTGRSNGQDVTMRGYGKTAC